MFDKEQHTNQMKTNYTGLIAILLSVVCIESVAQVTTYGNFKLEDQQMIFQKIFLQDSVTLDKIGEYFGKQPFAKDVQVTDGEVNFELNELVVDYKKFGFSQVATPSVMQTGKFYGHVSITVKEGKYRVTVRDINFTGDLGYKKIAAKDKLTNYACRDNGTYISPDWTKPNTLGLLDKAFTDKLEFVAPKSKKNEGDW
jgi:hypothetical protein